MKSAMNIEDLRQTARGRLPRAIFDYIDRGSYEERTLASNRRAFDNYYLRQKVMVDVSKCTMTTTSLGSACSLPIALGPTGLTGLMYPDGEIHACRAAQNAGIPYCLSTASICSIEDVRAAVKQPFWFQLYIMRDRGFVESLIKRADAAGCPVLIATVDLAAQGQRHQDMRNGLSVPPRLTWRNSVDIMRHPAWALRILNGKRKTFGNFSGYTGLGTDIGAITRWINEQFDSTLTWKDLDWLRAIWPGKLVIKGIMSAQDATEAVNRGADAIVVSNHGGRQLDGARASLDVLPAIADALSGRAEVYVDGGIRSGQDVAKAMALGAQSCWLGRAFLYGLACGGQAGVEKAIDIVARELLTSLKLMGHTGIEQLGPASIEDARDPMTGNYPRGY